MFVRDILSPYDYTEYNEDRDRDSSEMLTPIYQTIRCHVRLIPQCRDHFKYQKLYVSHSKLRKYTGFTIVTYYPKALFPLNDIEIHFDRDEDGDMLVETHYVYHIIYAKALM